MWGQMGKGRESGECVWVAGCSMEDVTSTKDHGGHARVLLQGTERVVASLLWESKLALIRASYVGCGRDNLKV